MVPIPRQGGESNLVDRKRNEPSARTIFLQMLRNFFPMLVGSIAGAYFAVKYFLQFAPPSQYAFGIRIVPLFETPEVYIPFYISVAFIIAGILINALWIYILAKLGVGE